MADKPAAESANTEELAALPRPVLRINEVSSILDLQTEFLLRKKAAATTKAYPIDYVNKPRNNILALTKEEKKSKTEMSQVRTSRIRQNEEQLRKEESDRIRQRKILEEKAAIYDRMSSGESLVYDDGKSADFLVDFHAKKRELEEQNAKTERDTNNKWNESEKHSRCQDVSESPIIVHYDPNEDKGRVFGASHVPLPFNDEEARQKKINELKEMTQQTNLERAKRKKIRRERKAEEQIRVNRIRVRKGLPPLETKSSSDEGEEEGAGTSDANVSEIPLPSSNADKEGETPEAKKPRYGFREWDKGKVGNARWISAQREERDDEFRPPRSYFKQ